MKAQKFLGHNIVFAENQTEYENLPGYIQKNGVATFLFRLTKEEIKDVVQYGKIWISTVVFDNPMMPIKISVDRPKFPVHVDGFTAQPTFYIKQPIFMNMQNKVAVTGFEIAGDDLRKIAKTREIWVTMSTFGTSLQPIGLDCRKPKEDQVDVTQDLGDVEHKPEQN